MSSTRVIGQVLLCAMLASGWAFYVRELSRRRSTPAVVMDTCPNLADLLALEHALRDESGPEIGGQSPFLDALARVHLDDIATHWHFSSKPRAFSVGSWRFELIFDPGPESGCVVARSTVIVAHRPAAVCIVATRASSTARDG